MKKTYIQPACDLLAMGAAASILAASPNKVDSGDGSSQEIGEDKSTNGGWAGSKGNSFGEWDTDTDED